MRKIKLYNAIGLRFQPGEQFDYLKIRSWVKQAQRNGTEIIVSTLAIEGLLDNLISSKVSPANKAGEKFLSNYVLKSDVITFASKRKLVLEILKEDSLLDRDDAKRFGALLQDIMTWRNAFAHGEIVQIGEDTCIEFAQMGPQKIVLTDEYWAKVEKTFGDVFSLCLLIDLKERAEKGTTA